MGDPRKHRRKYSKPRHPWEKERIEAEIELKKEYGLKNKKEIWRLESKLKHFASQAKSLIAAHGEKAENDKKALVQKLIKLGLLNPDATLDDILTLKMSDLLERRLQTQLLRRGMAKSVKQARQFIVHGHITVSGKKITVPSYLVSIDEESSIKFADNSPLKDENHPERFKPEPEKDAPKKTKEEKPKAEDKKLKQETKSAGPDKEKESKSEEHKDSEPEEDKK